MALNYTDYSVYHVESQLYGCPADPRVPSIAVGRARHIGLLGPGIGVAVGPSRGPPGSGQEGQQSAGAEPMQMADLPLVDITSCRCPILLALQICTCQTF